MIRAIFRILLSAIFGSEGKEEGLIMEDKQGKVDDSIESMNSDRQPGSSKGSRKCPVDPSHSCSNCDVKKMKLAGEESSVATCEMDDLVGDDFDEVNSEESIEYAMSVPGSSGSVGDDADAYEVISTDELYQCMRNEIQYVSTVLQQPENTTRQLLAHFQWDKEKLIEAFYAGGEAGQNKLFQDAKISNLSTRKHSFNIPLFQRQPQKQAAAKDCDICYEQKMPEHMLRFKCGHIYCKACWATYLTTQIMDEGRSQSISCISPDCEILVDDDTVRQLVTDPAVILRYEKLELNSYIQCNRAERWCPSPGCTMAMKVSVLKARNSCFPITCTCGFSFCFNCSESPHSPIQCDTLKLWLKKNEDDSETYNWISVNTKACPNCKANIQKNGGCNHMMCRNISCKHEFCWVCLGPWVRHDPYRCNNFNANESNAARTEQEKSRKSLHRYLFYFNRFADHRASLSFENKLHDVVKAKMEDMMSSNMSWVEVQCLKVAVDVLCRCRQTLMYTYVFAYYSEKTPENNEIEIFEANQQDLQSSVEKLSGYLEREMESVTDLIQLKQIVQDMTKYCESRRKVLLAHIQEGHDKDWWKLSY